MVVPIQIFWSHRHSYLRYEFLYHLHHLSLHTSDLVLLCGTNTKLTNCHNPLRTALIIAPFYNNSSHTAQTPTPDTVGLPPPVRDWMSTVYDAHSLSLPPQS